jgi:hypothetical protein
MPRGRCEHTIAEPDGNGSSLSADHLFIDREGIPTLVEDKRSANPESWRQVVAQMLDYASLKDDNSYHAASLHRHRFPQAPRAPPRDFR